ncbi:outer membrane protein assembly factor BamC [Aidingimonas lacisalsi]|uniref:outer membrane protein assembly factor BamC n=1 Tax=Aidingimonas lacisalsi TaxID=2604086 RepID=UPI0013756FE9|nr:outer membrane protein assembly factor BamC [Aidingimonas lacisalsi]
MKPALKWMPLVVAIALAASGCASDEGYYHDRDIDYTEAEMAPPLTLPESRNTSDYRNAMPVPAVNGTFSSASDGRFEPPRPQPMGGSSLRDFVEAREMGDDRWLLVSLEPATLWPQLEAFVERQGMRVSSSDPQRGMLETSRGTLRVRQGIGANASEVRCTQGGAVAENCLSSLHDYLKGQGQTASNSALASERRSNTEESGPSIQRDGEEWVLMLNATSTDRVWAELSHQLNEYFDQEGRQMLVEENPQSGEFLIDYMTMTERERGFVSIVFSPDVRQTPQRLRLSVEAASSGGTVVRATNASEKPFTEADARELLDELATLLR